VSRPLPPEVYRRRRIVAATGVLGIVLVLWLLVRAVTGGGGESTEATPTPTPTATETATTELPEGTVPASLTTGDTACDPQTVRVSPSVPADQSAGADVQIALTVSTTASTACVLEASAAQLVVVIDDGSSPVYDSTSCNTSLLAAPISLSPEWATVTTVTWNGRASGSSCSAAESFAGPGEYTIKLGTLGGEPGSAGFTLAPAPAPPAPAPTDPAQPDPTQPDPNATPEPTTPVA